MKKQITEIEREIIEKGNRSSSVAVSSSTPAVTTVATISQSTNCKVTSSSSLTTNQFNVPTEKQTVDSRTADIDLESLDPLGASASQRIISQLHISGTFGSVLNFVAIRRCYDRRS